MPQPIIQPMPEEASRILQQQLTQLLNHASAGEVVSFAFAVELRFCAPLTRAGA